MYALRERKYHIRVPLTINLEDHILRDFRELCYREKVSMSAKLNSFMEEELKKEIGLVNPIRISYERQNKCMSLLNYLQEAIDINQEVSGIKDQRTLSKLKGIGHSITKSADRQSLLLYKNNPLEFNE